MFIKNLFQKQQDASAEDKSFWKNFEARVKAFSVDEKGARSKVFENAYVIFGQDRKAQWKYELILQSFNSKDDLYVFPLTADLNPTYDVTKEGVLFDFTLNPKLHLLILFEAQDENYEVAGHFREIIGRLIYQTQEKKPFSKCEDPKALISNSIKAKGAEEKTKQPKISPELLAQMGKLEKDPGYILAGLGKFSSLNPQDKSAPASVIYDSCIFAIFQKDFKSDLQVLDAGGQVQYHKEIDEGLYYYLDSSNNSLTWVDIRNGSVVCLNFALFEGDVNSIKGLIPACILQKQKKKSMETIAKESSDWDKYYVNEHTPDETDDNKYSTFSKNRAELRMEDAYSFKGQDKPDAKEAKAEKEEPKPEKPASPAPQQHPASPPLPAKGAIKDFAQGKSKEVVFVTRDKGLEVYKYKKSDNVLEDFELSHRIGDLNALKPYKLTPFDQDTKILSLDQENFKRVAIMDPEKGKIVSEWQPKVDINDITFSEGKDQTLTSGSGFLAVSDKEILDFDTRTKEGIVRTHPYKSDYKFEKIIGAGKNAFAVSSAGGDIRLYRDLSENAKNLIPSVYESDAVDMDVSKDGALLLVAHPHFLLLVPTYQGGTSAFEMTFKKDNKPNPKVLRISPQALAQNGVSEIKITGARFDEKAKEEESYIVASAGEYLALWSLARVLRGQTVTSNLKKMSRKLVASEFKYNSNDLVAAFDDQLYLQPTKERTN